MNQYAIVSTRTAKPILSREEKVIVNRDLVEAESPELAIHELAKKSSVAALDDGVTYEVYAVGDRLQVWYGQYDEPPMDDHRATSAKLVFSRRLDLERS